MNPDVLAPYTQNIAQGKKNDSRINAVYNGCLVLWVGGSQFTAIHIMWKQLNKFNPFSPELNFMDYVSD